MKHFLRLTATSLLLTSTAMTTLAESTPAQRTTSPAQRTTPIQIQQDLDLQIPPRATGYDTYHIYVAGPQGGEIAIDGPTEPPADTQVCGIRWTNPVMWYWAAGEYSEQGSLDIPNNGVNVSELRFTGPYDGCGNEPYLFVTPATPDGWPPNGAISLIVQAYPGDVEWLDAHGNVIPKPPEKEPDPEPPSECDLAPEFCEIPDDLQTPRPPVAPI